MLPLHNGTTVLHDDQWCGHKDEVAIQLGVSTDQLPDLPHAQYGGSQVDGSHGADHMEMVRSWFDPELLKDKNFVVVYAASESFPKVCERIEFWRMNVAYQCTNPEYKKGARGISETIARLAYFSPAYVVWTGCQS